MAQSPDLPGLILDLNTRCPDCKYEIKPEEMQVLAVPRCPKCGYSFPPKEQKQSKIFLVELKEPSGAIQRVRAAGFELQDEHLVLVTADGQLVALFLLETVKSFNEMPR